MPRFHRTPTERAVIRLMPPGTVDMLALRRRDVEAIEKIEIKDDPDNPDLIQIHQFFKNGTKLEKDIHGFTSSQL